MLSGTYLCAVTLRGKERHGTLTMVEEPDGTIHATAKILGYKLKSTGRALGDGFDFVGTQRVLVKTYPYHVFGCVDGDLLVATAQVGERRYETYGVRQ